MIPQFSKSCKGLQKSKTFSQTRKQLHLNTISNKRERSACFHGEFLCGLESVKRFVKVHLH